MNIKDVLLGSTYPKASSVDASRWAASFAELVNCRVAAFAAAVKIEVPGTFLGNALMNASALAGAEVKKSKENAARLLAALTEEAEKHGVPHEEIREHCRQGRGRHIALTCCGPDLTVDDITVSEATTAGRPCAN